MRVIECQQYSDAWYAARRGIPTASNFGSVLTAKQGKPAAAAEGYIHRLIGERFDAAYPREEDCPSPSMRWGTATEPLARDWYSLARDRQVRQVGFCVSDDGLLGCSPDGLVDEDGGLEIKCPTPATHVRYLLEGELPPEYRCQVHGSLIVTGRAWWDFLSYCPGLPEFVVRTFPDEFTEQLRQALVEFCARYEVQLGAVRLLREAAA